MLTINLSSNGANLNWANELLGQPSDLDSNSNCDPTGHRAWIFAIVNAAPYLAASLFGCWLSDPLSERLLGRRAPIAYFCDIGCCVCHWECFRSQT